MESRKRKREEERDPVEDAIITFHAPNGRTFSRVFKAWAQVSQRSCASIDKTLATTKETVRKKLGLAPEVELELAQLRDGKKIDLEDDDDFLAFRAFTRTNASLNVEVTVVDALPSPPRVEEILSVQVAAASHKRPPQNSVQQSTPFSSIARKGTSVDRSVGTVVPADSGGPPLSVVQDVITTDSLPEKKVKKSRKSKLPAAAASATAPANPALPDASPTDHHDAAAGPSHLPSPNSVDVDAPLSVSKRSTDLVAVSEDAPRTKKRKIASQAEKEYPVASTSKAPEAEYSGRQELSPPKKVKWGADIPKENSGVEAKSKSAKKSKKAAATANADTAGATERKSKKKSSEVLRDDGASSNKSSKKAGDGGPTRADASTQGIPETPSEDEVVPTSKPAKAQKKVKEAQNSKSKKDQDAKGKSKSKTTKVSKENPPTPSQPTAAASSAAASILAALKARSSTSSGIQPVKTPASASTETTPPSIPHKPPPPAPSEPELRPSSQSSLPQPPTQVPPPPTSSKKQGVDVDGSDERNSATVTTTSMGSPKRGGGRGSISTVSCPVCLKVPFHLRYKCPIVTAGPESIRRRIAELQKDPTKQQLQAELKHLLLKGQKQQTASSQPPSPPKEPVKNHDFHSASDSDIGNGSLFAARSVSPEIPPPVSLPTIPTGSEISEVVVQGKDSDSSSESSDSDDHDEDDETAEKETGSTVPLSSFGRPMNIPANPSEEHIEALLRGPVSSLRVSTIVDEIFANGDNGSESEQSEGDEGMASEEEERNERAFRRLSQQLQRNAPSSDEEEDEEEDARGNEVVMDVDQNAEVPPSDLIDDAAESSSTKAVSEALGGQLSTRSSAEPDDAMDVELDITGTNHDFPAMLSTTQKSGKGGEIVPSSEDEDGEGDQSAPAAPSNRESSPDVPIASLQHEDDPIEPSEEPESPRADDDPIEPVTSQATWDEPATPSTPLPKPGTVRKMRDRNGKVRGARSLSLSAKIADTTEQTTTNPPVEAAAEQPAEPAAADVEPTPSASVVPVSLKRRGRPPLSAEVKAERARIAAEKAAEKKAQKEEKARQKSTVKPTRNKKSAEDSMVVDGGAATVDGSPTVLASSRVSQKTSAAASGWETLSVSPSLPETTMVDELRSSSPEHAEDGVGESAGPAIPASSSSATSHSSGLEVMQDELATPMVKTTGVTSATPLFLASSQPPSRRAPNSQVNGNSSPLMQRGSASQTGSLLKSALRSVRPVSTWKKIPRLSDIASQPMFTPLSSHPVPPHPGVVSQKKSLANAFGANESSSESSDSDSDEEPVSHIPKGRRAGAQKK
ncbi:hypothetical protein BDY19DRAFT_902973 [Irpex rosettiformis]|uniref:Uncharacterized protein n=1 Tax=Irpex rosettiformis TaxID=378272 RepID=A0ACB8UGL7_9APHY|nr:hypothetical protein BDY19DRAFT_902973 [Irpex rosettiformis]